MGKSKKKGKSKIDWDELVRASSPVADGSDWHTGPASMALDDEDGGGGGGSGGGDVRAEAPGAPAGMEMGEAVAAAMAGRKKREFQGCWLSGCCRIACAAAGVPGVPPDTGAWRLALTLG
jgi:hypothetical protein